MKYDVLVIAGTTESRQVIEKLLRENPKERILASVATELGKEMLLEYGIDIPVERLLMPRIRLPELFRRQ